MAASEQEKEARGTRYTPREILQQPESWGITHRICKERLPELKRFLQESGIGGAGSTVYLVGAGTSDYIGQALAPLLRRQWGCETWAVPSTSLLSNFEDFVFPERGVFMDFIFALGREF